MEIMLEELYRDSEMRKTSRSYFNEAFLGESPQRLGPGNYIDNLIDSIHDYVTNDTDIIDLGYVTGFNLKKIEGNTFAYYWFEDDNSIILAVELDKLRYTRRVTLLGKKCVGPPWAVDLYRAILDDVGGNITLTSDKQLTDSGISIWKRLFDDGDKVTVYDIYQPGSSMKTLNSVDELTDYFGNDVKYQNYRYVLSRKNYVAETRGFFHTRRIRELSGMSLED